MKQHIVFQVDVVSHSDAVSFQVRRDDAGYHVGENGTEFSHWPVYEGYQAAVDAANDLAAHEVAARMRSAPAVRTQRVTEIMTDFECDQLITYDHLKSLHNRIGIYPHPIPELMPWLVV